MRFRLGINGTGSGAGAQQAGDGVSNAFRTLSMLPLLQAQAEDQARTTQAENDLRSAQQRQADAHAALFQQQADEARTQAQRGSVPELLKNAALQNGVPLYQAGEAADYYQTGQLPQKYDMPSDMQGPTMPKPQYADPTLGAQIMKSLGLTQQALTVGDKDVAHIADAAGKYQKQDAVRAVVADPNSAGRYGQAFAAADGKPLIQNVGNTGVGFNQYTGQGGTLDPALRALYGDVQGSEIRQHNASAAASYASAEERRAAAQKVRQDIELGGKGTLQQTDQGLMLVNPRSGTATPVLGPNGQVVGKAGNGAALTGDQAKANLFGARMTEAGAILNDLESQGVTRPGNIKSVTEGIAGALPLIGNAAAEAAGAATNWTQSPDQQRVEQAQRDFVNAVLRRESGAAISSSEFENARKQYFPQPGDSKAVREQKRRNREIATNLMLQEVPAAQRYRLGQGSGAPAATAPAAPVQAQAGGGATGSWGTPAAPAGWSIQRVN